MPPPVASHRSGRSHCGFSSETLAGLWRPQAIEKAFVADICRAPVSRGEMDQTALDRIIAAHLFQQVLPPPLPTSLLQLLRHPSRDGPDPRIIVLLGRYCTSNMIHHGTRPADSHRLQTLFFSRRWAQPSRHSRPTFDMYFKCILGLPRHVAPLSCATYHLHHLQRMWLENQRAHACRHSNA